MRSVKKTAYCSYNIGKLPKGCQMCVKGMKEVVFVTGICPKKPACYFCPISDKKKGKDVVYANEWPVDSLNDLVTEARLCESKGAGLTGGDPLSRLGRTIKIIKLLKGKFGKKFHIHLYTPLELVSEAKIKKLEKAGLDEIRFHPDLDDVRLWYKIAYKTKMDKGVEIPVIPGKEKETKRLIDFIADKVDFLNLNELELSDTNACKLYGHGFIAKDKISYGVKGSEELAKKLLKYCLKYKIGVHYCTVRLKDGVQLVNRIKRRAKNVKKPYDYLTKESTLLRGAIYLSEPDSGKRINKSKTLEKLKMIRVRLLKKYGIPSNLMEVDTLKVRLLTSVKVVNELKKDLKANGLFLEVVEELPTYDQFEVEAEIL